MLLKHVLALVEEESWVSERTKEIKEETVKLICIICTVKTNRFYIPGETKMVERLRKEAFDKGIFAALTYLYHNISSNNTQLIDIRNFIRDKVLNWIELNDLCYHVTVFESLIELLKSNPTIF